MKTCTKCKETKEYSEFPKDKSTKDGYTPSCKCCRYSVTNKWFSEKYKKDKEEVLEKNKKWRQENWNKVAKQRKESGYSKR